MHKPLRDDWLYGRWHEELGLVDSPYLVRWVVGCKWFSIRLHHWLCSDDERHFHDHPWWFVTLILKGGYTDISPDGEDHVRVGSVRYRPALHRHTVLVDEGGCWSLLLTGRKIRNWGFWVHGSKFLRPLRYFSRFGHHPCDD